MATTANTTKSAAAKKAPVAKKTAAAVNDTIAKAPKAKNPARTSTATAADKATPAVKAVIANRKKFGGAGVNGEDAKQINAEAAKKALEAARGSVWAYEQHKQDNCPGCGIHLSNGIGEHNQEVNGKAIKHKEFEFCCLGCGHEFGKPVRKGKATKGNTGNKGVHLVPQPVKGKDAAVAKAKSENRKRGVLAKTPKGEEVLCCSRTARKNGWTIVERLFSRKPDAPKKGNRATRLSNLQDMLG